MEHVPEEDLQKLARLISYSHRVLSHAYEIENLFDRDELERIHSLSDHTVSDRIDDIYYQIEAARYTLNKINLKPRRRDESKIKTETGHLPVTDAELLAHPTPAKPVTPEADRGTQIALNIFYFIVFLVIMAAIRVAIWH